MPRGFFTQCACILLGKRVPQSRMAEALETFSIEAEHEPAEHWGFGGPAVSWAFRPEANGRVMVDLVDHAWPDGMGDPKRDPMLFGAWGMGNFGPITFPGSLERAGQQCWAWPDAEKTVAGHSAFVRVRTRYVMGAGDDALLMPDDWDPLAELHLVTDIAQKLLQLPEALCYFNPNGEVLRGRECFEESLEQAESNELMPLDLWMNIRLFRLEQEWSLMDTVGNGQLDLPDLEACFSDHACEPEDVDLFLRNLTLYLQQNGEVIGDGDTTDGPGDMNWRAESWNNPVAPPPRHVLALAPDDGRVPPTAFTDRPDEEEGPEGVHLLLG